MSFKNYYLYGNSFVSAKRKCLPSCAIKTTSDQLNITDIIIIVQFINIISVTVLKFMGCRYTWPLPDITTFTHKNNTTGASDLALIAIAFITPRFSYVRTVYTVHTMHKLFINITQINKNNK